MNFTVSSEANCLPRTAVGSTLVGGLDGISPKHVPQMWVLRSQTSPENLEPPTGTLQDRLYRIIVKDGSFRRGQTNTARELLHSLPNARSNACRV